MTGRAISDYRGTWKQGLPRSLIPCVPIYDMVSETLKNRKFPLALENPLGVKNWPEPEDWKAEMRAYALIGRNFLLATYQAATLFAAAYYSYKGIQNLVEQLSR